VSDDEPPRLPETTDPFALLGLEPGADERAAKKAYARLIKVFRPDRARAEFERVHAAFEHVKAILAAPPPSPSPPPPPSPSPPPSPPPLSVSATLASLFDAADRGDHASADAVLASGLDARLPLDDLLGQATPEQRWYLVRSPALTWPRLAAYRDDDAAHAVLLMALEVRLDLDPPPAALALLADEALIADAHDAPALAAICLRGIAAFAWRAPAPAPATLLARYRRLPRHRVIDALLDRVEHDVRAGALFLDAADRDLALPAPLVDLLCDAPVANPARFGAIVEALRAELRERPRAVLGALDHAVRHHPDLATAIDARLLDETHGGERRLADLPPPVFRELSFWLRAHGAGIVTRAFALPLALALASAALVGPAFALAVALAMVATAAAANAHLRRSAPRAYARSARPVLADIIGRVGVSAGCVHEWLTVNRRLAPRLLRFRDLVAVDAGLHLFGRLSVMVASHAGDDADAGHDGDVADDGRDAELGD